MLIQLKSYIKAYSVVLDGGRKFTTSGETDSAYIVQIGENALSIPKENCIVLFTDSKESVSEESIKPILKPFTFEEWNKDRSQTVYTISGIKVTQLTYFENLKEGLAPFVGVINNATYAFNKEGKGSYILMLESKEKEYYMNVYKNGDSISTGTPGSKEHCDGYAKENPNIYIKTISFKC